MEHPDSSEAGSTPAGSPPKDQLDAVRRRQRQVRRIVGMSLVSLVCVGLLALLGSQLLTPAPRQATTANSLIGRSAPDFTLPLLSVSTGQEPASPSTMHLASLKGKPIILNFWASWCGPCKHEAPLLESTWRVLQRQGVLLIGIDFQEPQSDAQNFLRTYRITYPNVVDRSGSVALSYDIIGLPDTFFLNRQGVIVSKVVGELTAQSLQSNLRLITSALSRLLLSGLPSRSETEECNACA